MDYVHTTIEKFPFLLFDITEQEKRGFSRKKEKYKKVISTFDIETTTLKDIQQAFMYVWQMAFLFPDNGVCFYLHGRTWGEFQVFLSKLREKLDKKEQTLIIFVHNLSFEFQFLKGVFQFSRDDIFALKSRKVAKVNLFDCFEFRCSYIHSNMSLDVYLKKFNVLHRKKSGENFDYTKIRTPSTPLPDDDLEYIYNDVIGLCEAIYTEMKNDGDTLYTIPLTSTGYVRRDIKKALKNEKNFKALTDKMPDYDLYKFLRRAFRGGNTHANRFLVGDILENVYSYDRKSSYPEVQINRLFPMGKWRKNHIYSLDDLECFKKDGYATVFEITFFDLKLKDYFCPVPYLTFDKGENIEHAAKDNGRVLSADRATYVLTDVDFEIVKDMYKWEKVEFGICYFSKYGELPPNMKKEIIKYFKFKTELDGVKGMEIYYMKSKNKLNSLYGLCAQKPLNQNVLFNEDLSEFFIEYKTPEEEREEIRKYNVYNALSYAWGVWVTAWARYELQRGIDKAGNDFVYADTDSVKSLKPLNFTQYNKEKETLATLHGSIAFNPNGKAEILGCYEFEGKIDRFRTWGAKKYVCQFGEKLVATVAGVVKDKAAKELEKAGGLEAFKLGFVFTEAGGNTSIYNDNVDMEIDVNGEKIKITDNVAIVPDFYTLGLAEDYKLLLKGIQKNGKR